MWWEGLAESGLGFDPLGLAIDIGEADRRWLLTARP
jgi:hypothetical protein